LLDHPLQNKFPFSFFCLSLATIVGQATNGVQILFPFIKFPFSFSHLLVGLWSNGFDLHYRSLGAVQPGPHRLGAVQQALKLCEAPKKHVIRSEGAKYYTKIGIKHILIHAEDSYRHVKFV
jgi:hypothetical protein